MLRSSREKTRRKLQESKKTGTVKNNGGPLLSALVTSQSKSKMVVEISTPVREGNVKVVSSSEGEDTPSPLKKRAKLKDLVDREPKLSRQAGTSRQRGRGTSRNCRGRKESAAMNKVMDEVLATAEVFKVARSAEKERPSITTNSPAPHTFGTSPPLNPNVVLRSVGLVRGRPVSSNVAKRSLLLEYENPNTLEFNKGVQSDAIVSHPHIPPSVLPNPIEVDPPIVATTIVLANPGSNNETHRKHRRTQGTKQCAESSLGASSKSTLSPSTHSALENRDMTSGQPRVEASWGVAEEIPPFEVTSLAAPSGNFGDHIRMYAFDQASKEFPWHKNWNHQCPELKARFTLLLRKIYSGPWEPKTILAAIGGNLRERRCRLKKKFETYKNWKAVPRPSGCTKDSWLKIYESTKDERKMKKSELCKTAANARMAELGCSHRCGSLGVKGIAARHYEIFKREATDEELSFGKRNGFAALEEKIYQAAFNDEMPSIKDIPQEGMTIAQKQAVHKPQSLQIEEASISTTSG